MPCSISARPDWLRLHPDLFNLLILKDFYITLGRVGYCSTVKKRVDRCAECYLGY